LEAGPLSQWLFSALAEAELPVVCVETRHMQAVLKAQINKTDRNDARGMAQMMRAGLYRPVFRLYYLSGEQGAPVGPLALLIRCYCNGREEGSGRLAQPPGGRPRPRSRSRQEDGCAMKASTGLPIRVIRDRGGPPVSPATSLCRRKRK
jgi:hypothetical protein